MIEIDVEIDRIPDLGAPIGEALEIVPDALGEAAVETLQSGSSLWPVDTGLSKASFWYLVILDAAHIRNYTDYAADVENLGYTSGGDQPAYNTLRQNIGSIAQSVREKIADRLNG